MTADAEDIFANDCLLRRIHPLEVYVPPDGPPRPFSSAFKARQRGETLSVFVERLLRAEGLDEQDLLVGNESFHVVGFSMELIRELELDADLDPDAGDPIPARGAAHAVVTGTITKGRQTRLATECQWRVPEVW